MANRTRRNSSRRAIDAVWKSPEELGLSTIAFPGISTGVYGYPMEEATEVAITSVRETLLRVRSLREIIFCCFSNKALGLYERQLAA
ncbi:MAG: macro domain-containing protein [Pirellulales bacterium]